MIVVNERWIIDVDAYNYIVCRNSPKTGTKDGKVYTYYPAKSYHRTLADALDAIYDEDVRISMSEGVKTLAEAVQSIRGIRDEVRGLIHKILEDDGK